MMTDQNRSLRKPEDNELTVSSIFYVPEIEMSDMTVRNAFEVHCELQPWMERILEMFCKSLDLQ